MNFFGKFIYTIRDTLWSYPEVVFTDDNSLVRDFHKFYFRSRPYSHFGLMIVIIILVISIGLVNVNALLGIGDDVFIEGQVVGVDKNGVLQRIGRVSPLVNTTVQAEKDLIELIYQSLLRVTQTGAIEPVLVEDYVEIDQGEIYRFKLKQGVLWQDGEPLTTADVEATFNLLKELEADDKTSTLYSRAAVNLDLIVIDDLSFELHFKPGSVIPGFFEAISFKILPAHKLTDVNPRNITTTDPIINRKPIGTGPFKLVRSTDNTIILEKNKYSNDDIGLKQIIFKLYPDEVSAVEAIRTGQIHALSSPSQEYLQELSNLDNVQLLGSNAIHNQYWAMYFNLGEEGPDFFADRKIRQALSSAINREEIISTLQGFGKEAYGPIPETSFAYVKTDNYVFNQDKANALLEEAGWKYTPGSQVRSKDGVKLEFNLLLVDNLDRRRIADVILEDLAAVGVQVNLEKKTLEDVALEHISTRRFDALLYGVQTFIDPDRYDLFHSSQIAFPGLNIASYVSESKVSVVREGEIIKIPEADDALDNGRKFIDQAARKREYNVFQRLIAADVPAVFLYHPVEVYVVSKRVKNVRLDDINSNSERFRHIDEWRIEI